MADLSFDVDNNSEEQKKPTVAETKKVSIETEELEFDSKVPDAQKMITVSADVFEKLVNIVAAQKSGKGSDENMEKLLTRLTSAVKDSSDKENRFIGLRPVSVEEVDKDDILDAPVMFFNYSYNYTIWDDQKFGQTVNVPYGRPIKFKMNYRVVDKSIPKQVKYITVSVATIYSKKVLEFMKNHSSFNVRFFMSKEQAVDLNAAIAEKLAITYNIVNRMTEQEVVAACTREAITINTQDVSELRRRLAMKRAKNMMKDDNSRNDRAVKDFQNFINNDIDFITDGTSNKASGEIEKGPASKPLNNPF